MLGKTETKEKTQWNEKNIGRVTAERICGENNMSPKPFSVGGGPCLSLIALLHCVSERGRERERERD